MSSTAKVTLPVRLDPNLKKAFLAACNSKDTTASRELRDYMRKYIAKNGQGL